MNARSELTDAAWVVVDTELDSSALAAFCADVERLFRINPLLEVKEWQVIDAGHAEIALKNLATRREVATRVAIDRATSAVTVNYESGLKRRTSFEVEATAHGSRLTITDDYSGVAAEEARARSDEVDPSLTAWGRALHAYLKREKRWGRHRLWQWAVQRVWLRMTPAGRRITYMLLVISALEVLALAVAFALYAA